MSASEFAFLFYLSNSTSLNLHVRAKVFVMSKTVSSFFRNIIQRPFNVFKPVLSPAFLITAVGMRNESDCEKEGELVKRSMRTAK